MEGGVMMAMTWKTLVSMHPLTVFVIVAARVNKDPITTGDVAAEVDHARGVLGDGRAVQNCSCSHQSTLHLF